MHKSWCDNELKLSILIRYKNKILWSSIDNVILIVDSIKLILVVYPNRVESIPVQIGSSLIRFGSFRISVYMSQ